MHMPHPEQPPDAAGIVIVDIGGDRGAAVITTPCELAGAEIEIRAAGTVWDGSHTGVHERQGPGITTTAAVFGSLRAGRYELRIKDAAGTQHPAPVVVEPAQVTWVTWAGATPVRSQA
jgi:phage gp45-like